MAYPAVICLKNTAFRLLNSPGISIQDRHCRLFIGRAYVALEDLVVALKKNDKRRRNVICVSERVMGLEEELREAASNLEDAIETLLSAQILSQSECDPIPPAFSVDLREMRDQLECFLSMAERMEAAYREDDDEAVVSPPIYFEGGDPSKMVGMTDYFHLLKHALVYPPIYRDISISEMAGIGKTPTARKFLEDPQIKGILKCRIFVPVGLEPEVNYESPFKRVMQAILAQVKPDGDAMLMDEVENLNESFWKRLIDEKSIIVLDDVWSKQIWPQLRRILPKEPNGCTMLVTSRTRRVGPAVDGHLPYKMRFMNKEESWDLLRGMMFGEEAHVPDELVKAGKKIAENCEGLPLLLIAVANLLSSAERTPEFWNMVAANKENHIFVDAYEQISEVLKLILLRYLAFTCNGNLSPSISRLWNLQCLIVHKHLSIKFTHAKSYLPVEIWDLQELQHLEIMGRNLRDPPPGASLPSLSTLLDVDVHSCSKGVLQSIPELEKLIVQIELGPDAAECLTCFDHISDPPELKSFQYIVKNPNLLAPLPLPVFGSGLKKLMLSGFGYPWKEMNKIAVLPSLEVLKLQCYAFRGPKWEAENGFLKLISLSIEDTDLVQWTSNEGTFASLLFLTVKNCYKLQKIPCLSALKEIKLVDCNPAVLTCAEQMEVNYDCEVSVNCSWDEGNLKQ